MPCVKRVDFNKKRQEFARQSRKLAKSSSGWVKDACTVENLKKKFPISIWLPKYRLPLLFGDVIAGLTVALIVIPQSLALAQIAELPPQYGLYTAFMSCFVYCFFGTSRDVTLGPTAVMALMAIQFGETPIAGNATYIVILTMLTGVVQLAVGFLNLGFAVNYISHPVLSAFISAASLLISWSQIKKMSGIKNLPRNFALSVYEIFSRITETKYWDVILGVICVIILTLLKKLKEYGDKKSKGVSKEQTTCIQRLPLTLIWILGTSRNAIVVLSTAGMAAGLLSGNGTIIDISLTGSLKPGLPPFQFPNMTLEYDNTTVTTMEIIENIGVGLIIVPLVSILEAIAIGKALAKKNNYRIDANQEIIALGLANFLSSFVSAYPVTASFSRSTVNAQTGSRSPACGLVTGGIVILALVLLTPYFYYIPSAALAAVIITAVLGMLDLGMICQLWRSKKFDLLPYFATFFLSIFVGIEIGILTGIGLSLVMVLVSTAKPDIQVTHEKLEVCDDNVSCDDGISSLTKYSDIIIIQPNGGLHFPAIEMLHDRIIDEAYEDERCRGVIIDFRYVVTLDFTGVHSIVSWHSDLASRNVRLVFACLQNNVEQILLNSKINNFQEAPTVELAIQMVRRETGKDGTETDVDELSQINVHQLALEKEALQKLDANTRL